MSVDVREVKKATIEILLRLWDGTLTTASVPDCESCNNKSFIFYHAKNFVDPTMVGLDPLKQTDIDDTLDQLLDKTSSEHSLDEFMEAQQQSAMTFT